MVLVSFNIIPVFLKGEPISLRKFRKLGAHSFIKFLHFLFFEEEKILKQINQDLNIYKNNKYMIRKSFSFF